MNTIIGILVLIALCGIAWDFGRIVVRVKQLAGPQQYAVTIKYPLGETIQQEVLILKMHFKPDYDYLCDMDLCNKVKIALSLCHNAEYWFDKKITIVAISKL